ncbi:MAG: hypothetical protein P1P81_06865 [Desulfobulbales bacterium]|nr:hypothetical protein [Desulfobulbales bacterium]
MDRKLFSEKELLSFLNVELRKTGEPENCFFESIVRLRVDDRAGCNWAYAKLKGLADDHLCPPAADKIVTRARDEYNLK